ncbi:MAG: DUF262 domain-containing protein [Thermoguttaceae bacterium]|nr:DUF262 domain-containing protein [Thermoguttaceae bacterium]
MDYSQFEIKGRSYPLSEIFRPGSEFSFEIPEYQRPYAWAEKETSDLFHDLYDFFELPNNELESYFLGSIVLIRKDNETRAQVVDGQQRLVTLTMLLALLTSKLNDPQLANECKGYVFDPGNRIEGIEPQPRLKLRERDQEFFREYVQSFRFDELGKLNVPVSDQSATADPSTTTRQLNDSQINIQKNAKRLSDLLDEKLTTQKSLLNFARFISKRCCVIVVSTPSEESAFRIFAILNNRGMPLLPCDILKARIVGKIGEDKRQAYAEKWEDVEENLGRDTFANLFQKIREQSDPSNKDNILDYYQKRLGENPSSERCINFIDNTLLSNHDAIQEIDNRQCSVGVYTDEVNEYLRWLNETEDKDWQSSAIAILAKYKSNGCSGQDVRDLFKMLERLASYFYITFADNKKRQSRYRSILKGIKSNCWRKEIDLTLDEKTELLDILDKEDINKHFITKYKKRQMYLFLRIDAFLPKDESTQGEHTNMTRLEYVLPEKLDNHCWSSKWSKSEHTEWRYRIANMVLLPISRRNPWRYNSPFNEKKEIYFFKNGLTPY